MHLMNSLGILVLMFLAVLRAVSGHGIITMAVDSFDVFVF